MRVFGFGSGMDIDSMVKEIMTAKRAPLDKLKQQKQTFEWQRESYREVNSKLVDFKLNKLSKYNKGEEMNPQKAVLAGNSTAVSVKANADATPVPMEMYVEQISTRTTITTTGIANSYANGYRMNTALKNLPGGGSNADAQGNYTLTIGEAEFIVNKENSISQVVAKINADAGVKKANVVASFDELTGKLILSAKEYGEKEIGSVGGSLLTLFKTAPTDTLSETKGKKGILHVKSEGAASFEKLEFDGNKTIVNGVQITLQSTSTATNTSKLSLEIDSSKSIESIKSFIKDYNDLIELMNKKIDEKSYRDFPPLTDAQKKDMSEDDIKNWEAKAKSGLLKNDTILSSAISNMREVIYKNIGELSQMGIDTGQYFEGGKLILKSEDDLKKALENKPTFVTQLFQGSTGNNGIFSQMSNRIDGELQKLIDKAGTSKYTTSVTEVFKTNSIMGDMLKSYNKRINDMTVRMNNLEKKYYKQYAAMEQAMSKYNSQSTSLSNFISK